MVHCGFSSGANLYGEVGMLRCSFPDPDHDADWNRRRTGRRQHSGNYRTIALKSDGSLWTWGKCSSWQILGMSLWRPWKHRPGSAATRIGWKSPLVRHKSRHQGGRQSVVLGRERERTTGIGWTEPGYELVRVGTLNAVEAAATIGYQRSLGIK